MAPLLTFTLRFARLSSGENRWERKLLIFLTSVTALVTKSGGQSEEPSRSLNRSESQSVMWTKGEGKEFECPTVWKTSRTDSVRALNQNILPKVEIKKKILEKVQQRFEGTTDVFGVVSGCVNQETSLCFCAAKIVVYAKRKKSSQKLEKRKKKKINKQQKMSRSPVHRQPQSDF